MKFMEEPLRHLKGAENPPRNIAADYNCDLRESNAVAAFSTLL
jgi:hypothetical protein